MIIRDRMTQRNQIEELLELKSQAWDDLPDYGSDNPEDKIKLARFQAICECCEIFRVNSSTLLGRYIRERDERIRVTA
jgi:hypothetical protein